MPRWLLDPLGPIALRWGYLPWLLPWLARFFASADSARVAAAADAMLALHAPNPGLYRELLADTGDQALVRDSCYLHVFRDPAGASLARLEWRLRRERGVPLEVLDGPGLRAIEPAISPAYRAAVMIEGQARATDPMRLGKVLAAQAEARGAVFVQRSVEAIEPHAGTGFRLRADAGDLEAGTVVVAAGAWSARLIRPLGVHVPLEAERGYHLEFSEPGVTLANSVLDAERKFASSSMSDGLRCAGTAEFSGLDWPPAMRRAQVLAHLAKGLLPDIDTSRASEWSGVRPATPDSLPCIGALPGHPRLFAAFGHGHLGLTAAPMTARLLGALASGERAPIDPSPYRVERFA